MSNSGNSVTFLNSELLTLSNEARKKYPDIKEASEKVLALLRSVKEKAPDSMYQELAKTNEVLQPFLLACETKQPKLVSVAVSCIQKLASSCSIEDSSATLTLVISALTEVSLLTPEIQLKLLQIIPILITSYQSIHQQLLASALQIGFRLYTVKDTTVSNSSAAIVRQILIFLFDKVPLQSPPWSRSETISMEDAIAVFRDLCTLASSTSPNGVSGGVGGLPSPSLTSTFTNSTSFLIPLPPVPRTFALELLESILANHATTFQTHDRLLCVPLCEAICPLVIKTFSEKHDFTYTIRLMRIVQLLLAQYMHVIPMEGDVFLSLLIKLSNESEFPWVKASVLEVLLALAEDPMALRCWMDKKSVHRHRQTLLKDWVAIIQRLVLGLQQPTFLAIPKVPCLDQLDKSEPPVIAEEYFVYLAIQTMYGMITSLEHLSHTSTDLLLVHDFLESVWSSYLTGLSNLLRYTPEAIGLIKTMTILCGQVGFQDGRDTYLTLLASHSEHPLHCIQAMIDIVHVLMETLDDAWLMVLDTLSTWERLRKSIVHLPNSSQFQALPTTSFFSPSARGHSSVHFNASSLSSSTSSGPSSLSSTSTSTSTSTSATATTTSTTTNTTNDVVVELDGLVKSIIVDTPFLTNRALTFVVQALCRLTAPHHLNFAVDKLKQIMDLHLPRILKELPDQWSMVIHHFINLTGHGTNTTLQRQTCDIVCEIVMQAFLVDQAKAFIPLQELVKLNGMASKLSLDTLTRLLQMHGPQVTSWEPIYTLLESVANDEGLIRLAFPCLELMSTDYFMTQPALTCVQTVRLYAQRSGDINIALTCIRLLWHIADTASEDSFWLTVIHQLLLLCLEKRAPVRNGCVTSLLRSIANHSFLNDDQVATCYFEIMFPLLHKVVHCNLPDLTTLTSSHVIYQHHSRDTGDKQWNETRVLVIQGIEEAFAHHFKFMNDPTFQQLLIHLNVYLMETHLEVKVAVIKLVHSFLKLPITEFHAFRMYQWWFGVISQYHQATFPIPSLTSAMSSSTPSSSVSPLSSASLPTSPSFSNGQSSSLTSESTPLPSPTLPHSAPVNAPSTSIVVSHELLTLLVNLLVEMLPMISTLFSALPRTLLSKLTTVLMISQVCLNHPKDTDGLTSLQQGVFEITFFLLQSEASLPWVFETYAEWLKLTPPSLPTLNSTSSTSSCTYPTYLALSHEVLKVVVKYATQAPTGPFPNALASIFLSFHEIFQQPHVLYQGVTECWMEFLKFLPLLPTTTTTSSSSKTGSSLAVESMSTLALIFFETRPQASIETMVQDVKVIQTLIQTFPNYFVNDLSEFWNALEISTRFSVTTPLDLPNPISSSTSTVLSTSKAPVDVRDMYCMEGLRWLIRSGPIWSSAWDTSVPRMVRVVSQYVLDKQHSRIPLPRLRDVELEVVCSEALMCQYLPSSSLKDTLLTMSPTSSSSIKKDEQGELKWGLLPKLLQHHPWAHLWAMYPWLVQCVKHVTGQPALMELVCQCLEKCGSEF